MIQEIELQMRMSADLKRYWDLMDTFTKLGTDNPALAKEMALAVYEIDQLSQVQNVRNKEYLDLSSKIDIARREYAHKVNEVKDLRRHNELLQKQIIDILNKSI